MSTYTEDIVVNTSQVVSSTASEISAAEIETAVAQASTVIETITGVPFESEARSGSISRSDAHWIEKAVVFQAVWMLEQVDSLSRMGMDSISQDGVSVNAPNELAFVLAPLAKRALNNCAWSKSGTVAVAAPTLKRSVDPTVSDAHGGWRPL